MIITLYTPILFRLETGPIRMIHFNGQETRVDIAGAPLLTLEPQKSSKSRNRPVIEEYEQDWTTECERLRSRTSFDRETPMLPKLLDIRSLSKSAVIAALIYTH